MWSVLFDLRPGDGLPLVILLAHSFLKGAARVLLETPANSLFLSRFSIVNLPLIYLVVEGAARVHDGDKLIAALGPGEVFGELAALDPEPRMASVMATEPTLLLRMGHAELGELMTEHPEVATGIIHVLCRRLRKQ